MRIITYPTRMCSVIVYSVLCAFITRCITCLCVCVQTLAEAFYQWQDSLAHEREVKQRLAECLQRWRLKDLTIAFDAFRANATKQHKAKAVSLCFYRSVAGSF